MIPENGVWYTVKNIATAAFKKVHGPIKLWVLRPVVTVVAVFAVTIAVAIYAGLTSAPEIWNSDSWKDNN